MEIIENNRKVGCHLMMIGNKIDLEDERQVERTAGQNVAEDLRQDIQLKFKENIHGEKIYKPKITD